MRITTTYPDPATSEAAAPLDICCRRALPVPGAAGRCQLWAGHCGDHAAMFVRDGKRVVRTWSGVELSGVHDCADYRGLPWARGFPLPAWRESALDDG